MIRFFVCLFFIAQTMYCCEKKGNYNIQKYEKKTKYYKDFDIFKLIGLYNINRIGEKTVGIDSVGRKVSVFVVLNKDSVLKLFMYDIGKKKIKDDLCNDSINVSYVLNENSITEQYYNKYNKKTLIQVNYELKLKNIYVNIFKYKTTDFYKHISHRYIHQIDGKFKYEVIERVKKGTGYNQESIKLASLGQLNIVSFLWDVYIPFKNEISKYLGCNCLIR